MELSEKLKNYLDKVSSETRRQINFEEVAEFQITGMGFSFVPNGTDITIRYLKDIRDHALFEMGIAHEVTHGRLLYGKGYCDLVPTLNATNSQKRKLMLVYDMIADIYVNKMIQDEGFSACAPNYFNVVKEEIAAMRQGQDYYCQFAEDLSYRRKFILLRYIQAWAYLEYFDLQKEERRTLSKFLSRFQEHFFSIYEDATMIAEIIRGENIFTSKGFHDCIAKIVDLWGLSDVAIIQG